MDETINDKSFANECVDLNQIYTLKISFYSAWP